MESFADFTSLNAQVNKEEERKATEEQSTLCQTFHYAQAHLITPNRETSQRRPSPRHSAKAISTCISVGKTLGFKKKQPTCFFGFIVFFFDRIFCEIF